MKNLYFSVGNTVKVKDERYKVKGYISFEEGYGGGRWYEYKLISTLSGKEKWLSIDTENKEYALYTMQPNNKNYSLDEIYSQGYTEADNTTGIVVKYAGAVDVEVGEKVNLSEYEDKDGELIFSIEDWDGQREYSKGFYLDEDEIILEGEENNNSYKKQSKNSGLKTIFKLFWFIIAAAALVVAVTAIEGGSKKLIYDFVSNNYNFTYETSITSDLDNTKKADVFKTDSSVEEAAKLILDGINGKEEDVQENSEDGTVIITTNYELALIYRSEESKTLVQVSSREYVYSSRTNPYKSRTATRRYYRSYYYAKAYKTDSKKYRKSPDGYSNYTDGAYEGDNTSNKYVNYSNSIRQSSTSTRTSSGGGVSSGK